MNLDRVIAVRNSKTIFRDGDRCIKVFNTGYSKSYVFGEALNQVKMEEAGLSVPRLLEVKLIDGKWSIVSQYIKGKDMSVVLDVETDDVKSSLDLFVAVQCGIHRKECLCLDSLVDRMRQNISESYLDGNIKARLLTKLDGKPKMDSVCHGDFEPSNVILSSDGAVYVIDWSEVTRGDPLADSARTYLLLKFNRGDSFAKAYLEAFCNKCGAEKDAIFDWIPIVAASALAKANRRERAFLEPLCVL